MTLEQWKIDQIRDAANAAIANRRTKQGTFTLKVYLMTVGPRRILALLDEIEEARATQKREGSAT